MALLVSKWEIPNNGFPSNDLKSSGKREEIVCGWVGGCKQKSKVFKIKKLEVKDKLMFITQ